MSLADYTAEQLEQELERRQFSQPSALLSVESAGDTGSVCFFTRDGNGLMLEVRSLKYPIRGDELRRLSVMVGVARHEGKQEKRSV